jgi:cation diffusion facilitator CzcD-associated flavoprotein CzcO
VSGSPRTLIVGAGPAGLAMTTALACRGVADPELGDVEVVDPSGGWMRAWDRRFAAQAIPHLRSPAVHHPHPDPFALLEVTPRDELTPSGGASLPSTRAFAHFCDDLVTRLGALAAVTPASVTGVRCDAAGRPTVQLDDGSSRRPDRVVLATNARRPAVPTVARSLVGRDPRVRTAETADVGDTPRGGHVVVLGGGLSAGHLAVGAAERGAEVTLLTRRRLTVKRYDTHPTWLGPKKRRPFENEPDPAVRRRSIDVARGGGSIPHGMRRRLRACEEQGSLTLRERVTVTGVRAHDGGLQLRCSEGTTVRADALWLATGGVVDVVTDPLCGHLDRGGRTPIAGGLPELDRDLSWPGTRVHLAGAAGGLVLGPTAGNLVGHRRAALRIIAAMCGADPAEADRIATGTGACPADALRRPSVPPLSRGAWTTAAIGARP